MQPFISSDQVSLAPDGFRYILNDPNYPNYYLNWDGVRFSFIHEAAGVAKGTNWQEVNGSNFEEIIEKYRRQDRETQRRNLVRDQYVVDVDEDEERIERIQRRRQERRRAREEEEEKQVQEQEEEVKEDNYVRQLNIEEQSRAAELELFNNNLDDPLFDYQAPGGLWTYEGIEIMKRIQRQFLVSDEFKLLDDEAMDMLLVILRTRPTDEVNSESMYYHMFKFFLMINNEIDPSEVEDRLRPTRKFRTNYNTWKREFQDYVCRDPDDVFIDEVKPQFNNNTDIIMYRMNSQHVFAIIDFVISLQTPQELKKEFFDILTEGNFTQAAVDLDGEITSVFARPAIATAWRWVLNCIVTTFIVARNIWSKNMRLSELLRLNDRHHKRTSNGLGFVEAFPFLITKTDDSEHIEGNITILSNGIKTYMQNFLTNYDIQLLDIKIWFKRVLYEDADNKDPVYLDESYFAIYINSLSLLIFEEPVGDDVIELIERVGTIQEKRRNKNTRTVVPDGERHDLSELTTVWTNNKEELIEKLDSITEDKFERWLLIEIDKGLSEGRELYSDRFLGGGSDHWSGVMASRYMVTAQFATNNDDGTIVFERQRPEHRRQNDIPRDLRVFCSIGIKTMVDKLSAHPQEYGNIGALCLWQAHWVATYQHMFANGRAWFRRNIRREMLLEKFKELPDRHQEIFIYGDLTAYENEIKPNNFVLIIHERDDIQRIMTEVDLETTTPIACFDGHAVCSTWEKMRANYIKSVDADNRYITPTDESKPPISMREGKRITPIQPLAKILKEANVRRVEQGKIDEKDFFWDIETCDIPDGRGNSVMKPYLIIVVSRQLDAPKIFWGWNCVEQFITWFDTMLPIKDNSAGTSAVGRDFNMIGYNCHQFDLIPIVRSLARWDGFELGGNINDIKTLSIRSAAKFFDLRKIIPFGKLSDQARLWKTDHQKLDFDHTVVTEEWVDNITIDNMRDAITYCYHDCLVLMEVWEAYSKYAVEICDISPYVHSAASFAFNTWRRSLYGKKKLKIEGVNQHIYDILRESYKGGITLATWNKLPTGRKAVWYDINSSYPASMMNKIPISYIGTYPRVNRKELASCTEEDLTDTFLYVVAGMEFKEEFWLPLAASRHELRLNYNLRQKPCEVYWGVELKAHLRTGYIKKGIIQSEMKFNAEYIFKDFIEPLYKERQQAKIDKNKLLDEQCKLKLNSVYGKTAQQLYPKSDIVTIQKLAYYLQLNQETVDISNIDVLGGDLYRVCLNDLSYTSQIGTNLNQASFITACSRAKLINTTTIVTAGYTKKNIMYMDTDSLLVMYDEDGTDPFPQNEIHDTELGKWKKEEEITDFLCLGKKSYYCLTTVIDPKTGSFKEKIRCKGVQKARVEKDLETGEDKIVGGVSREDFVTAMTDGSVEVDSGVIWKRLKAGVVQKSLTRKVIRPLYDRLFDNLGSSIPYIYNNEM